MSGFLGILFPGGGAGGLPPITPSTYIAFGGTTAAKRISVYNWNSASGFGSLFTTPSIPNNIGQVSFVRDNSVFSASFVAAPYFSVWQWSGVGFGTQYSNPASALSPGSGGPAGFTWTQAVDAILTSNSTAVSFPQAWAWSQASGFGSKYSNGAAINSIGATTGITLNGDNTQVAFSQNAGTTISLYPWSTATGFGTKYASPVTIPPFGNNPGSVSFNQITNDVAIGSTSSPFIAAYPVTSAGFGAKYSNPSTAIGGTVYAVRFSPNGGQIAVGNNSTPAALKIYQWGAGFGSLYSGPSIPTTVNSADWSSTGSEIAGATSSSSPYVRAYPWTTGGVGSQYSNPSTAPGVPNCVSFSNQTR
jgi:hypothetical protein